MKHKLFITLTAAGVATLIALSSCQKDVDYSQPVVDEMASADGERAARTSGDRIDEIVSDLSRESYSFSFSRSYPSSGITRTAYGADNYLVFADPQDVICPDPIRARYKKIPIWKRPNFIWPTCPDMIIDFSRLQKIQDILAKANPERYGSLKTLKFDNGGFLASEKFFNQFSRAKLDKADALVKDLDFSQFIILNAPDVANGGVFTRNFYGYANLNDIFSKYKTNLKDIIKPTLKGCFDPLVLRIIRKRLIQVNPEMYQGLTVQPIPQTQSVATLSF